MTGRPLPPADNLTYPQYQGWACVWCGASLYTPRGGVSVGRAKASDGTSIEVYACPGTPCHMSSPPVPHPVSQGRAGSTASHPEASIHTGGIA